MFNILPKEFPNVQGVSKRSQISTNPYAIDVIRAKRKDLVSGISHTEDLLDLLVTEGVVPPGKRSVILSSFRTSEERNSRVLDVLVSKGERACRKFFHPCLMLTEPDLYQKIKAYVGCVNDNLRDSRRQLIGYLLERDKQGLVKNTCPVVTQSTSKGSRKPKVQKEDDGATRQVAKGKEQNTTLPKTGSLFSTVALGELSSLEEILQDTDVNAVNSSNETLLHVAAEHGHLSIIELLLHRGAQLDVRDEEGYTPLHRAALRGHSQAVRGLVNAGAPIYALDKQSKTPLHLSVKNKHLGTVKTLVEEERKLPKNQAQGSFLHTAAREDDSRLAEVLLQCGAVVDARDNHKWTALFHAVSRGCEKTATVLLSAGATVDRVVIETALELNRGPILRLLLTHAAGALGSEALGSALLSAVKKNQEEVVAALVDCGADVNARDQQGYTPLLLSAELGHTEVFRALAAKHALVDATLPNLCSALHLAAHSGSVPIAQDLLERGFDPNTPGPKAHTPLHVAAQLNRSFLVGLLLNSGAQVNAVNQDGLTALHMASQQGQAEAVTELLKGQADTGARDRQGRTALHWAASTQRESSVVGLLLSAKADPNATDKEKRTPMHLAAAEGRLDAVTSLLAHKAKGGAKDMDGSTPLHQAAAHGHAGVVTALLSSLKKKDVDERNAWRRTPLHAASERGHDGVVELLLRGGAKINALDNSKDTPLHCASRSGHREAVKRLVGWGQGERKGRADLQATNNVGKTPLKVAEDGDTREHEDTATLLKKKMLLIK
ncbi:CARD- and ANK-domain containing inflammasome adapter protein [Hypomesus transpacificus]|uniref:CARD- and ANK-domain containing inflammasome adapter protein n=1 Tax=Hypomesus transpacificus TaxID=137520 RepID=UPI001F0883A3|nr:CARD- and ANK-domain containing inflammasome adapter protein [Hypomesus transpacificus]